MEEWCTRHDSNV